MSIFICEKCGKEFNSKSHYTQHVKRKTICVSSNVNKSVPVKVSVSKNITIDTDSFDEIKKYYDEILNVDKSTYKSTNDEPTPIGCISDMITKIIFFQFFKYLMPHRHQDNIILFNGRID